MAFIMVDVETDGPIPGDYSMISFGAVLVNEQLDKTFYGRLRPISDKFLPDGIFIILSVQIRLVLAPRIWEVCIKDL